ncbi:MAG: FecR domain-containing protein [Bacteroidota bacterium]
MDHYNLIQKKLTDSLDANEEIVFNNWIQASESNRLTFNRFKAIWIALAQPTEEIAIDLHKAKATFWQNTSQQRVKKFVIHRRQWYSIAASIILLIVSGLLFFKFWYDPEITLVSTDSMIEATLPDGSDVWLYKNSKLTYQQSFNSDHRQLKLEGLAFFEVSENKNKPFTISCTDGTVTVVGTSFEVKSYQEDSTAEVSVTTGKVAVDFGKKSNTILLQKSDKVIYNRNLDKINKIATSMNELAWKNGNIIFDKTIAHEAFEVLSEYFHKNFIITNGNNCKLTTRFKNPSLEEVIEEMAFLLDAKITVENNSIYVEANNCK